MDSRKEKLEYYKSIVQFIGGCSFFGIPIGLISWIFWLHGWKITLISLIIFFTLILVDWVIDSDLENIEEKELYK